MLIQKGMLIQGKNIIVMEVQILIKIGSIKVVSRLRLDLNKLAFHLKSPLVLPVLLPLP
jgi:hypothetical protein